MASVEKPRTLHSHTESDLGLDKTLCRLTILLFIVAQGSSAGAPLRHALCHAVVGLLEEAVDRRRDGRRAPPVACAARCVRVCEII